MRSWPSRRARAFAIASGPLVLAACSVLVSHADSQCATDADYAKFVGTTCVQGGCVAPAVVVDSGPPLPDVVTPGPCVTTADCLRQHGTNWICRHTDSVCVSLLSTDCPSVIGQYTADDVLLFGALIPLYGPHSSTGAALGDALRLAVSDFENGVPSPSVGKTPRPVAVVLCNESTDVTRATQHLRDDLLVPAIVGTGESASTLKLVNEEALGGVLLMSPRAGASLLSSQSSGLVWRTCPSDSLEGAALVALTHDVVVPAVVAQKASPSKVVVAVVHATDVESTEIDATIAENLVINGLPAKDPANAGEFFRDVSFGDPDEPPEAGPEGAYQLAIDTVTTANPLPDVIVLVGGTQAASSVLPGIEKGWPAAAARRPQYVLSSGVQTTELVAFAGGDSTRPSRVLGTAPGGNGPNVAVFRDHYRQDFGDGTVPQIFGAAQAFDALYTLAFAASIAPRPAITGADLSSALRAVLTPRDGAAPTPIVVGKAGIPGAFTALASGAALALDGASAPLAFNTTTGDIVTDVQVWCIAQTPPASPQFKSAGLAYVAASAKLGGTLGCGP